MQNTKSVSKGADKLDCVCYNVFKKKENRTFTCRLGFVYTLSGLH